MGEFAHSSSVRGLQIEKAELGGSYDDWFYNYRVTAAANHFARPRTALINCVGRVDREQLATLTDGQHIGSMAFMHHEDGHVVETECYPFGGTANDPEHPMFLKKGIATEIDLQIAKWLEEELGGDTPLIHPSASSSRRYQLREGYGVTPAKFIEIAEFRRLIEQAVASRQSRGSSTSKSPPLFSPGAIVPQHRIPTSQLHDLLG